MKILAISDRPPTISIKKILEREGDIEMIITLGDFEYSQIRELADIHHIPKLGVYGNHCSGNYFNDLGIINMHLVTYEYKGITFGGLQGCVRYKPNPDAIMFTQEEAKDLLSGFPRVDVFLAHCPPRGINDEEEISHQGFEALREYCDLHHPKYLLHGHTYPEGDAIKTRLGETQIEYVYADKVITL